MPGLSLNLHPCRPPVWARGGHAQTILGHVLPSPGLCNSGQRMEVPLPDGDRLVCRVHAGPSDTVVYLFHGLGGDAEADYMHRTTLACQRQGATVIRANHRGCGEGAGLALRPYHSGSAADLACVLAEGRTRFPGRKHVAIGFSLSGNALLLLLSRGDGLATPDRAIAVNAPIDLRAASLRLRDGLNRIYDLRFVHRGRAAVRKKQKAGIERADIRVPRLSTIWEFDEIYTAPAAGFRSRDHYYESCSTQGLLDRIEIPTVLLTSKDDPFVDHRDYLSVRLSPAVHLHLEEYGGHMGYLSRDRERIGTSRWLDYALAESVAALGRL